MGLNVFISKEFKNNYAENMNKIMEVIWELSAKGQIISECPYEIIVSPIRPTKKFPRFLP